MRVILIIICFAVFATASASAAGIIVNGSFENNGKTISDITSTKPFDWNVNIGSKFGGEITGDWKTRGSYSLWLYSNIYSIFNQTDFAEVSQQVDLTDANEIIFDIYLTGYDYDVIPWNGNKVAAYVKIDNSPNIWESNSTADGAYNVNVPIDSNVTGVHTLKFGIRSKVSERLYASYYAYWDSIKFDAFCGGFGNFAGDLNRDCYVDFADVDVLADNWLRNDLAPAEGAIDALQDGAINLSDFAVLANQWMLCSDWQNANCVEVPLADINFDGIVNFLDYSILAANWGVPTDLKADIDKSGRVDYKDLAIMNEQWLEKSWLYRY